MTPPPPLLNLTVQRRLGYELARWGITPARLARCAWRAYRIPRRRVDEALAGIPGHLVRWTEHAVDDWILMIREAWQF